MGKRGGKVRRAAWISIALCLFIAAGCASKKEEGLKTRLTEMDDEELTAYHQGLVDRAIEEGQQYSRELRNQYPEDRNREVQNPYWPGYRLNNLERRIDLARQEMVRRGLEP